MRSLLGLFLFVAILAPVTQVGAHEARPIYVIVKQIAAHRYSAHWKVPNSLPSSTVPSLVMPPGCQSQGELIKAELLDAYLRQQEYVCKGVLSGHYLGLSFPYFNPSVSTLFRVVLLNGEVHTHIMGPEVTKWRVPNKESFFGVAKEYMLLGINHIFSGIDHLLFIACLVFIARTRKRILVTITGFTVSHSLTLALSALRIVELPILPVEAAIALSIIFLAHEIATNDQNSLTWRYPIAVASSFGLLHGFGFAAILRAIGLPQTELPAALLFFNVGVEIGQILFVLLLALVMFAICRLQIDRLIREHEAIVTQVTVYFIGVTASYWFVARVMKFWV